MATTLPTRTPFPELPASSVKSVEESDHKQDIFNRLLCGWSPSRVSKDLHKRFGVVVPPNDIKAFMEEIPPALLLPQSYLRKRLNEIDIEIDAVGEMSSMLALAKQRLDAAAMLEEASGASQPMTEKALATYWKMLGEFVDRMQALGELPMRPLQVEDVTPLDRRMPKLRDLLEDHPELAGPMLVEAAAHGRSHDGDMGESSVSAPSESSAPNDGEGAEDIERLLDPALAKFPGDEYPGQRAAEAAEAHDGASAE